MNQKIKEIIKELSKNRTLYLFLVPAGLYVLFYGYLTLPYMIIAFERYNFKTGIRSEFVGLANFRYFFSSSWAWTVTRNTLILNFFFIIFTTLFAVLVALFLNEIKKGRLMKFSQSAMLFPYFISWVVVSYILRSLLSYDGGMINKIIVLLGGNQINFYSSPQYWYPILVILQVWKYTGYNSIIYLSAITAIDEGIYEAAYVDGASKLQRIRYVTLPLLFPTICVMILMAVGRIFYGDFGMFYAIIQDNGILMNMGEVIDTYVFRTLKNTGDPSLSMAIGVYQSVIGFVLVCGSNYIVKKRFPEGSLF